MSAGDEGSGPEVRVIDTLVGLPEGLHMRPLTIIATTAADFVSAVRIGRPGGPSADVTSMLEMLALAIGPGEEVRIEATGRDADAAAAAVLELFDRGFPEPG
ncbi:MAG: HPr family phosphocarrier protein [Planctomycetota bacterium]